MNVAVGVCPICDPDHFYYRILGIQLQYEQNPTFRSVYGDERQPVETIQQQACMFKGVVQTIIIALQTDCFLNGQNQSNRGQEILLLVTRRGVKKYEWQYIMFWVSILKHTMDYSLIVLFMI